MPIAMKVYNLNNTKITTIKSKQNLKIQQVYIF